MKNTATEGSKIDIGVTPNMLSDAFIIHYLN